MQFVFVNLPHILRGGTVLGNSFRATGHPNLLGSLWPGGLSFPLLGAGVTLLEQAGRKAQPWMENGPLKEVRGKSREVQSVCSLWS